MTRPARNPARAQLAALAIAAGGLLAACGSEEAENTGEAPVEPPAAAEFPKAEGTLSDLVASVGQTDQIAAPPAGQVFTPGDDRFAFGLFDVGGEQITDGSVAIYAAHGPSGEALGPFPARIESLETDPEFVAQTTSPDDAKAVYVADVPFDRTGEWRLAAVIDQPDGPVATTIPSVVVDEYEKIPAEGEPAPEVHTPTLAEVGGDAEAIDTRIPPSSMHGDDLADALGKQPVVLLFATPALCVSRVCGPVVDIAEQVKSEYGDEAAFIHQEIWVDNVFGEELRPQVKAYGLRSEPWLFVIDEDGEVSTRIEGAFSAAELETALEPLLG